MSDELKQKFEEVYRQLAVVEEMYKRKGKLSAALYDLREAIEELEENV